MPKAVNFLVLLLSAFWISYAFVQISIGQGDGAEWTLLIAYMLIGVMSARNMMDRIYG